ncbi:MAG: transcriptional repressor [Actinomycetota bacterium]|jgi:Fe2+ or Zn2+ uptake regulation protein|nr:transcriptional repressor [Actinomycetota bacterium]
MDALQERGMRVTPQRAHVWRVLLESGGHLSADGVWEEVKGVLPGLELSTVYRALEALGEAGLVVDSRLPEGPRIFEARPAAHPHLVCESCGSISHLEPEMDLRLLEALRASSTGFEVQELHVVARGTCAACAGQGESEAES